jgi:hypothetical protein
MRSRLSSLLAILVLAGCGAEGDEDSGAATVRELQAPVLRTITPSQLSVGEDVTIWGSGFPDKSLGSTKVTFEGVYLTTSGKSIKVSLETSPKYINQGELSWTFGPNIPFTSEEDTGTFRGVMKVRNVGLDGSTRDGQTIGADLRVLPSILIKQMRPADAGCAVGITETTEDTAFIFELKTIGLKAGADAAPLSFVYTFMKENFQFEGYLSSTLGLDPDSLFPSKGAVAVVDYVKSGTTSKLGSSMKNVYVAKNGYTAGVGSMPSGVDELFGLTTLSTATLPTSAEYQDAKVNVLAVDATGQTAKRTIKLRIWPSVEVSVGKSETSRTWDPVPVSGCISGGDIGAEVTYSESTSETKKRSYKLVSKVGATLDIVVARLSAEFGTEIEGSVSSTQAKDLNITVKILPKQFGVFYRQTTQIETSATLTLHDGCGNTQDAGTAILTDWRWSPDLAKSTKCPPLPNSNLPAGKVYKTE